MFPEIGIGVAIAVAASFLASRLLISVALVDVPDAMRKVHGAPTPTSGGLGVALGFGLGMLALSLNASQVWRDAVGAAGFTRLALATGFAFGFMALGLIDDARPLGPRLKFAIFAALSLLSVYAVGLVERLPLGAGVTIELGFWPGLAGSALFVFTLVNSVNFMDGANGLAMGSVAVGLVALACAAFLLGGPGAGAMALCGAAALAGFLCWNYPHGRLFAGDSGALFAGALAALASLAAIHKTGLSPFIPPVLFFPILADVLLTLAHRVKKRRHVLSGHREHLYQIAVRSGWTHARVSALYWLLSAGCGALGVGAALASASEAPFGGYAPALTLAFLAAAALVVSSRVRRFARVRNMGET